MNYDQLIPFGVELRPTEKEFKNFKQYIYSIIDSPKYQDAGCVKIIPPSSFKYDAVGLQEALDSLTVYKPIEQQVSAGKGPFRRLF
jgi:hypothetical protein